jgi:hypothetical protein
MVNGNNIYASTNDLYFRLDFEYPKNLATSTSLLNVANNIFYPKNFVRNHFEETGSIINVISTINAINSPDVVLRNTEIISPTTTLDVRVCGVNGRYIQISKENNDLEILQIVVIDKTGKNVAFGKKSTIQPSLLENLHSTHLNYITNGNFLIPTIEEGSPLVYSSVLLNYGEDSSWNTTTPQNLYILNGYLTYFPNPTLINTIQYIRIMNQANIQQVINNLHRGVYILYFNYGFHKSTPANPISIYLNGVLIDTLPTYYNGDTSVANFIYSPAKDTSSKTTWYTYTKSIKC